MFIRFPLLHAAFVLSAILITSAVQAAPPELTSLFPPGAGRGQTVAVAAEGKFGRWPIEARFDRPGVEFKAADAKGRFSVTVAADAVPGLGWVRLYDEDGASALRPFVVGTLAEVEEKEPNDAPQEAQMLDVAASVVNGRFGKAGDVDAFAVMLRKGETLVASLQGRVDLASPMDASLQVVTPAGFVLAHNDDYHGLDPQIVFVAPADGKYLVRGFAFPLVPDSSIRFSGGADYIYRLTMTTGGFIDHPMPLAVARQQPGTVDLVGWNIPDALRTVPVAAAPETNEVMLFRPEFANTATVRIEPHPVALEVEPNDKPDQAQDVPLPVTLSGQIGAARDVDTYRFRAAKGQTVTVRVESRELGYALDPYLTILDSAGKVLKEQDDTGESRDATITQTFSADGQYLVSIRDLNRSGGFRHVYRLSLIVPVPDYTLSVSTDRFTVAAGKTVEVPVTINRLASFAGEIEVAATGLPTGVAAATVTSLPNGDSAKLVKLGLTAGDGAASGALQITGKTKSADQELLRAATAVIEPFKVPTRNLWLTVGKK